MTSYIYGSNVTEDTPAVTYSNQSTLLNGASPFVVVNPQLRSAIAIVVGLLLASHIL
jgi:hypothetical protein